MTRSRSAIGVLAAIALIGGGALTASPALASPPVVTASAPTPGAVTSAALREDGPTQQHWLSVPDSRIVANPYDFDSSGSELDQTGGADVPLSTAYYANDKALEAKDVLHDWHAGSATPEPPSDATHLAYQEDFASGLDGWTGLSANASAADGAVTVTPTGKWGSLKSPTITVDDVAATPYLTVTVKNVISGKWNVKLNTGGTDDLSPAFQDDSGSAGVFTFDLASTLSWTGSHSFAIRLWSTNGGSGPTPSAVFGSVTISDRAFRDDFATTTGWSSASHTSVALAPGGAATLSGDGYGSIQKTVTVRDVAATPILTLGVGTTTGQWALKINTGGADDLTPELQHDTSATGDFSFDLATAYGMSGRQTFTIKLFLIGDAGSSTSFTSLSIHPGSTWLQGADTVDHSWTPASLGFTAHYGDAGSVSGRDAFHDADALARVVDTRDLDAGYEFLGGAYSGSASYDAQQNVLTLGNAASAATSDYVIVLQLPAGTTPTFYPSLSAAVTGSGASATPPAATGAWLIEAAPGDVTVVSAGYALVGNDADAAIAAATGSATAASADPDADLARWTGFWDDYLGRVPVPQDFSIHTVDAAGVTPDQVEQMYYSAWIGLEMNVLPATPETGNLYAQLGTGKPSMWMNGTPGTRDVASWDSLLGMQDLVYADPENAWASFQGMMALVGPDGSLQGESLPSRKAQTAWILYSVTGDRAKLASVYDALAAHLRWESQHLRWILGSHDFSDERDAEFVASLIYDLQSAEKVSATLGHDDDVAEWKTLATQLTSDYERWFFPTTGAYPTVQKVYLDTTRSKAPTGSDLGTGATFRDAGTGWWTDPGLTMYTTTALAIPELGSTYLDKVMQRFDGELDLGKQLAGLAAIAIKAPDAQLMSYGLLDRGDTATADGIVNSLTRDIVRSGWFAEVYQQSSGSLDGTPIARGVRPSLFGISNFIDNVWMENGYRIDQGSPAFVRLSADAAGGVTGLTALGKPLSVDLATDGTLALSGAGARCASLAPAVGETVSFADCATQPPAPIATTTGLALSSTEYRQDAATSATVTVAAASGGAPSGTVTLSEGATALAQGALSAGIATLTVPSLSPGAHTLTAQFTPATDAWTASSSAPVGVTVTPVPIVTPPAAAPVSVAPPRVTGTAAFGKRLSATTGQWTPAAGLAFSYRWTANGRPIAGATGSKLTIKAAQLGKRIGVTVTARGTGGQASAVSKTVTPKAATKTAVKLAHTKISPKQSVRVTVTVTAAAGSVHGKVVLTVGKRSYTRTAVPSRAHPARATVTVVVPKLRSGSYLAHARFAGTATTAASRSAASRLRVTAAR